MAGIIGRTEELALLRSLETLHKSSFVAVYGRRRVGKTWLIRTAYEGKFAMQLTNMANVGMEQQLVNFHSALIRYFPYMEDRSVPVTWFQAFQNLIASLEALEGGEQQWREGTG